MLKRVNVNRAIRAPEVRVIGPEGGQLGIMPLSQALELAASYELDLVEVAPNATPPVCRIMDYGKFKYEQSKRLHESKRKQATLQVKEVKFRPRIDEHDYQFKVRHIKRFLTSGHKAKISLLFRGREITHVEQGKAMIDRIINDLKEMATLEVPPRLEGRNMTMILAPRTS